MFIYKDGIFSGAFLLICFPGYKVQLPDVCGRREIRIITNNWDVFQFDNEKQKRCSYKEKSNENKKLAKTLNKRREFFWWVNKFDLSCIYSRGRNKIKTNPLVFAETFSRKKKLKNLEKK